MKSFIPFIVFFILGYMTLDMAAIAPKYNSMTNNVPTHFKYLVELYENSANAPTKRIEDSK